MHPSMPLEFSILTAASDTSTCSHELHAAAQSPGDYYVAVHEGLYWGYIGAMDEKNETITSQGTYTGFISLGCRASGSEG